MEKSYWSHKNKISKIIVDFKLLLTIYFSFIYIYMNYANIAWYGGSEAWMFPYFFSVFPSSLFFYKKFPSSFFEYFLSRFLSVSFLFFVK